ncbi:MAG: formyltransferase family protein [Polyangiales bacterium]
MSAGSPDEREGGLRLLYLGLPLGALYLHAAGSTLVACGISRPDAPGMRRLRRALHGAPILDRPELRDPRVLEALRASRPDLVVSWFWTRRVPREALALARMGGVNVHPSLLPRHRGADPYFWTLRARDPETGVSVHRLDDEYDTGPIFLQRRVIVPEGADSWRLAKRLDLPSLEALRDTLRLFARGTPPEPVEQDAARATQAPAPSDDDCEIRWSDGVDEVLALVRAASPEPGAFTEAGGSTVVILEAERAERPLATLRAGEVVRVRGQVVITCGDGAALRVLRARGDDEDRVRSGPAVAELFSDAADVEG